MPEPIAPNLVAIAYPTPALALAGREAVLRLGADFLDDVGDAVIASVDRHGVIALDQLANLWSGAAKGTMLWHLLSGLLFLYPLLGVLKAETAAQLASALDAFGLAERDLSGIRQHLRPGQAMLFLWLARHEPDELLAGFRPGGPALPVAVDAAKLPLVHAAFAQAHQEAWQQRETAYSGRYVGH